MPASDKVGPATRLAGHQKGEGQWSGIAALAAVATDVAGAAVVVIRLRLLLLLLVLLLKAQSRLEQLAWEGDLWCVG